MADNSRAESIDYSHGNTKLKAYVAYDYSVTGKRPAIFMVHARNGLTAFAKSIALNIQTSTTPAEPGVSLGRLGRINRPTRTAPGPDSHTIDDRSHMTRRDRWAMRIRGFDILPHGNYSPLCGVVTRV
jgi:hypothetical protein